MLTTKISSCKTLSLLADHNNSIKTRAIHHSSNPVHYLYTPQPVTHASWLYHNTKSVIENRLQGAQHQQELQKSLKEAKFWNLYQNVQPGHYNIML